MDLVAQGTQANQQVQAVAMAEFNQLERLPLSALSADDSGLLQVTMVQNNPSPQVHQGQHRHQYQKHRLLTYMSCSHKSEGNPE